MTTMDMYKIRTPLSAGRRAINNEIFIRKPTTVCAAEVKYLFLFIPLSSVTQKCER